MPCKKKCDETPDKKHPCPDCLFCQWCDDARCEFCRRVSKPEIGKKLGNKTKTGRRRY